MGQERATLGVLKSPAELPEAWDVESASGDDRDRRAVACSLVIGLGFAVAFLGWALFWMPVVHGKPEWLVSPDMWITARAGEWVGWGAFGYVYQAVHSYDVLPLSAILLAPATMLGGALHLVTGYPFSIARPSMYLVTGPYTLAYGALALHASRALAWQMGLRRHLAALQVGVAVVVLLPAALMSHFEDVIAFAFVLYAVRAHLRGHTYLPALLLGVAVASQQWAILALAFVLAGARRGTRLRALVVAALPGALLVVVPLVAAWRSTIVALLGPVTPDANPYGHHGVLFAVGSDASRYGRTLAVVVSVVIGVVTIRRWPERLVEGLGAALLVRPILEPIIYPYYMAPGFAVFLIAKAVRDGRVRYSTVLWSAAPVIWAFPASSATWWWWAGEVVTLAAFTGWVVLDSPAWTSRSCAGVRGGPQWVPSRRRRCRCASTQSSAERLTSEPSGKESRRERWSGERFASICGPRELARTVLAGRPEPAAARRALRSELVSGVA